jgi:hypothetical protein
MAMIRDADQFAQRYQASITRDNRPFLKYEVISIQGVRSEAQNYSVIRYRRIEDFKSVQQIADGRNCPQVDTVTTAFANLSVPVPRLLDLQGRAHPTLIEGPPDDLLTGSGGLTVRTQARFQSLSASQLTFTANANSDVGRWFSQTLTELTPCWRPDSD